MSVETRVDSEKLSQLERKTDEKDKIIEALLRNGKSKDEKIEDLEVKINETIKMVKEITSKY